MITCLKSGDYGFPHDKFVVKNKLGQGATAKVFKVVNYKEQNKSNIRGTSACPLPS